MTALNKENILALKDLMVESVDVPEWGGTVIVRCMTGKERDSFERSLFEGEGEARSFNAENARAKLLVRTLVDEQGNRLFADTDADALGERNAAALDRLYDVAQRLSGIGKKEMEAAVKK